MGAEHSHALFHHGHSPVHHLPAHTKLVGTLVFVAAVAVTPRQELWAFAVYAAVAVFAMAVARLPVRFVARRALLVLPFLGVAALVPFIGGGETTDVMGLALSTEGLWAASGIVCKALLGTAASIVLAGTTEQADLVRGLARLRVPPLLVMITATMLRYLETVAGELRRARTAMQSRGHNPRWLWQATPLANSAGATFVRSYERGERVHHAMAARGFTGTPPDLNPQPAAGRHWIRAIALPGITVAVAIAALAS